MLWAVFSGGCDSPEEDRIVDTEEMEASSARVEEAERIDELEPSVLRGSGGRTFPGISARICGGGQHFFPEPGVIIYVVVHTSR